MSDSSKHSIVTKETSLSIPVARKRRSPVADLEEVRPTDIGDRQENLKLQLQVLSLKKQKLENELKLYEVLQYKELLLVRVLEKKLGLPPMFEMPLH